MYWPQKRSISVERDVKFDTPDYILYPENYPTLPQAQAPGAPAAPPAPPAPPVMPPPAPPVPPLPPVPPAPPSPHGPPATPAQSAPPFSLLPLTPLSRASSGGSGSPAMPGGLQPEAPDRPRPPPHPPSRGKGKAPQEPTHRSTRIPQLAAKERAIQCGEGTTGEEFDEPPSAATRCWMHPDHPHYYDTGALATDLVMITHDYDSDANFLHLPSHVTTPFYLLDTDYPLFLVLLPGP
jgi:hypothetical protein